MDLITDPTAVTPEPAYPALTGTRGWFTGGVAGILVPTRVRYWFLNMVMNELCNLVTGAGLTLDPTNKTQVLAAVQALINLGTGRFLGTQAFTAGGNFIPYAGTNVLMLEGVGAAGAGGGTPPLSATTGAAAPGGESGAYARIIYAGSGAGAVIAVGVGGVGALGAAGTDGGATIFTCGGTTITWGGGAGGDLGIASTVPCVQTSLGLANSVVTVSGPDTSVIFQATGAAGQGGLLLSLGGAAAGTVPVVGGIGKDGPWGGAHRGGQTNGNTATGPGASGSGAGAIAYGSGASASAPAYMGGNGANGLLLISMFT